MAAVLADYRTAPIDEKLRAMLALLETFTLRPDELGPEDVRAVLATGVTREMIRDAFYVAFLFNGYDRQSGGWLWTEPDPKLLFEALGWELPEKDFYRKSGQFLLKKGYRL